MLDYRIFRSPSDVDQWVSQIYSEQQLKELSIHNDMDSPLSLYKGNGHKAINYWIRKKLSKYLVQYRIPELNQMLCKYSIPENLTVFRFVDWKEFLILHWNTLFGRSYAYPGFLSTTLLKDYYSMENIRNGRLVIEFQVDKGCSGVYLPEVVKENPEYEILFPHHCIIKRTGWAKYAITRHV